MNIPKAIKTLELESYRDRSRSYPDLKKSLQLGIEALKRLQQIRTLDSHEALYTLPGEAED